MPTSALYYVLRYTRNSGVKSWLTLNNFGVISARTALKLSLVSLAPERLDH